MLPRMSAKEMVTVKITLRLGAEPIEGLFQAAGEATRPFRGWLELTSLLHGAARTPAGPPPERPSAGDGP